MDKITAFRQCGSHGDAFYFICPVTRLIKRLYRCA